GRCARSRRRRAQRGGQRRAGGPARRRAGRRARPLRPRLADRAAAARRPGGVRARHGRRQRADPAERAVRGGRGGRGGAGGSARGRVLRGDRPDHRGVGGLPGRPGAAAGELTGRRSSHRLGRTPPSTRRAPEVPVSVLSELLAALRDRTVEVVDLTAPLHADTPVLQLPPPFANASAFGLSEISRYDERGPAWYWNDIHTSEHTGTHFDAPVHWITA